jgi:type IX secretion system PorP/SprF family membrane protein
MENFSNKYFHIGKFIFKIPAIVLLIGISSIKVYSQDISFTMFNYSPLSLNPANTGNFIGNWRLAGNFRNQWSVAANPFRTTSVSFDTKFKVIKQNLGAGLFFISDESVPGGLNYNKIYASFAYEREINKNFFNIGFQFGYVFGSVKNWDIWDEDTRSAIPNNGEGNFKVSYPDVSAGICWKKNIRIYEPEVGVSLFHINTPNISFFENNDKEKIKYVIHSKVKVKFDDRIYLLPAILYMGKDNSSITILGTNIGYNFVGSMSRVKQVFGGFYLRNSVLDKIDSYSILIGTSIGRLDIAFSYDFNVSGFNQSSGNMGAYEISLIYRSISASFNSYSIPCERY